MKRLVAVIIIITAIVLFSINCFAASSAVCKIFNYGTTYYFYDNQSDYIVSTKGNSAYINKIDNSYIKLDFNYDIIKCSYTNKIFHFFLKCPKDNFSVIEFNYENNTTKEVFIENLTKTYNRLCSVDSNGNYYFVDYNDRQVLYKYSQTGKHLRTYKFDIFISQIDTTDGEKVVILTGANLCYLSNNKITTVQCEYPTFPLKMLHTNYCASKGEILDFTTGKRICSYRDDKVTLLSKGIADVGYNTLTYTPFDKNENIRSYKFNDIIDYMFGYKNKIFIVIKNKVYTIEYTEMNEEKPKTTNSDYTSKTNDSILVKIKSDRFKVDKNYISNISSKTTVTDFKKSIDAGDYNITLTKRGVEKTSGYIGTGMKINFSKGNSTHTKTLIVKGDITGDGNVSSTDEKIIMQHLIGTAKLSDISQMAVSENNYSKVSSSDLVRLSHLKN